jgi:hypothetical protein
VDQAQHAGQGAEPRRHRQRRACLAGRVHRDEDPAERGCAVSRVRADAGTGDLALVDCQHDRNLRGKTRAR